MKVKYSMVDYANSNEVVGMEHLNVLAKQEEMYASQLLKRLRSSLIIFPKIVLYIYIYSFPFFFIITLIHHFF